MPLTKRSYTFKEKNEQAKNTENVKDQPNTPLNKIKTRGRSFIGSKTPSREKDQEDLPFLSPFLRSSVRLKSFRKRKMANREENQVDGVCNKKIFMGNKGKDEIESKIEENIRMRDGIMKLISGCHDAKQAVEISKNLLTINSRVLSLMSSLQKKRSSTILKDYNKQQRDEIPSNQCCTADVSISYVRIPLMWKADSHFKTKSGEQPTLLYHMFCVFKIGDQVYDTPLIQFNQIDTDVTFVESYIFHDVPADFKLDVEVYYTVMHNPDNPAWTPIRSQKKTSYHSAPKYCLAAHCQLTVDHIKEGFITSDFIMGGKGASATAVLGQVDDLPENPLALWGQFSCQLRARPTCMLKDNLEGHLLLQMSNGGQPSWEKYFCRLRQCSIQGWKQSTDSFALEPGITMKLKEGMRISSEISQSNGENVLILTYSDSEKEPVLSFDNMEDLERWRQALRQAVLNVEAWKLACDHLMSLEEEESKKNQLFKSGNFYDQISVDFNDVRPISPRLGKKSSKYVGRTPDVSSKRSFYDQIIIDDFATKTPSPDNGGRFAEQNEQVTSLTAPYNDMESCSKNLDNLSQETNREDRINDIASTPKDDETSMDIEPIAATTGGNERISSTTGENEPRLEASHIANEISEPLDGQSKEYMNVESINDRNDNVELETEIEAQSHDDEENDNESCVQETGKLMNTTESSDDGLTNNKMNLDLSECVEVVPELASNVDGVENEDGAGSCEISNTSELCENATEPSETNPDLDIEETTSDPDSKLANPEFTDPTTDLKLCNGEKSRCCETDEVVEEPLIGSTLTSVGDEKGENIKSSVEEESVEKLEEGPSSEKSQKIEAIMNSSVDADIVETIPTNENAENAPEERMAEENCEDMKRLDESNQKTGDSECERDATEQPEAAAVGPIEAASETSHEKPHDIAVLSEGEMNQKGNIVDPQVNELVLGGSDGIEAHEDLASNDLTTERELSELQTEEILKNDAGLESDSKNSELIPTTKIETDV